MTDNNKQDNKIQEINTPNPQDATNKPQVDLTNLIKKGGEKSETTKSNNKKQK
jgi:hypothetical protein